MAFALGSTLLSSSYQVANNLPNQLYELVCGGMIVTAFLPVYVSVKKKLGQRAGNEYASNLLTLVVLLLGAVSLLCMLFPSAVIYTQSFYSDQSQMATSVFFFQFFAIQIVFYGCSAIVSGLLNASRDYLWSSIAPVANNLIVIVTFLAYSFVAPYDQQLALYIIAIGNPAGVFIQMAIQLPALKRNGIRIRPRVNLRDPALRETLGIGVPAVLVMLCSFAIVSVQNAASYNFADNGPSILAYARLWFTLPYSFLAVPITTAMFTELSDMQAEGNTEGVKRGIVSGTNQILFFMIPFAMYLAVFSMPLVTLYHAGAFTMENVSAIATYLAVWAVALPLYGVNTYLQKTFSSLRQYGRVRRLQFHCGRRANRPDYVRRKPLRCHAYQLHRRCRGAVLLGAGRVSVRISATNPGPIRSALCSARLGYGRVARRCRCRCRRCCDVVAADAGFPAVWFYRAGSSVCHGGWAGCLGRHVCTGLQA